jgi:glycosyltransferase involved in cell wall biosynthesis
MKPKILILSLGYYPKHIGGAEVAIKEITDRLGNDFEFHLIANRYDSTLPKTETIGNVTVHRIGFTTKNPTMADLRKLPLHLNKILYQFLAYRKAKQLQKEHHFSILWAMMAHATGVPAGLFKKAFPEVKYVLTLQEGDPPAQIEHKMRIFGNAFKRAFTDADTIQVISHFLGQWAKHMGYKREVIRIPNAVNIAHFSQTVSPAEKERVRQELQLAPDDIALVTTSRLVHKNGVDAVIRALPLLPEHIKFVIFGLGPDEAKLQALAKELGVAKRVVFYGFIDHALMPTYLKSCQIFIRPSRSEGMGNSFVEAMVAELPVIATQEGGISDFLFDAVRNPEQPTTGWAVDTESPSQIAEAVQDILANQEKTTAVLATARALALKDYDWDLVAKRMHQEVFTL